MFYIVLDLVMGVIMFLFGMLFYKFKFICMIILQNKKTHRIGKI